MIRIFQHGDHIAIAEIFAAAIHEIASEFYTEEQCLAWSSREPNYDHWKRRCELKRPFVAVVDSSIAGFLELDPDGHIDCAYINPRYQRQGIMTALVNHAVTTCFALNIRRVFVEASICAKPMFEKAGFSVIREQTVLVKGVELTNYRMELILGEGGGGGSASNHVLNRLSPSTPCRVKNIQVIDGAKNCVFDIFAASDEEFRLIFPANQNVAFIDEVYARVEHTTLNAALSRIWNHPICKSEACGIHGTLFFGLEEKKMFYPTRRDNEAVNPDGTPLRKLRA